MLVTENIASKTHQGTHTKFRELFLKTGILDPDLSEIISDAFNMRQGSDYDSDFEVTKSDAERVLSRAVFFVSTIQDFLKKQSS